MRKIELVFFRKDTFYLVECPWPSGYSAQKVAAENAGCNPGTIRVETTDGNVLWVCSED